MRAVARLSAILLIVSSGAAGYCATMYSITDLQTLGGSSSRAFDINGAGMVVGEAQTASGDPHAYLWHNGGMTDLGTIDGYYSSASGINDLAQIVGYSHAGTDPHAFVWENGTMTDLGPFGNLLRTTAQAINNLSLIVGKAFPSTSQGSGGQKAFLHKDGNMIDLGNLGYTSDFAAATDINNSGQIVGKANTASGESHAFLWEDNYMIDLDTLGSSYSVGTAINESGQVTGYRDVNGGSGTHAFLWQDGVMVDLGTLAGSFSYAYDVDNYTRIVGESDDRAFLWQSGVMIDLNDLIPSDSNWTLLSAQAINDKGEIVGYGINPKGDERAFLLTPLGIAMPEPGATMVAILTLVFISYRRR